jgi:hypothetical protein
MAISKLTQLARQKTAAQLQTMGKESVKWLTKKIGQLSNPTGIASVINKEANQRNNKFQIGGLYYFYYDPKTKEKLEYYDRFPLVLILDIYPDGFMGLNLHYLPIRYRVAFLDKLLEYASLDGNNDIKRIRVSYDILASSKRYREFKPCLKKYLNNYVQSRILAVQPNEWDIAVFLPIQQFRKASPKEVWQDSIEEIRK